MLRVNCYLTSIAFKISFCLVDGFFFFLWVFFVLFRFFFFLVVLLAKVFSLQGISAATEDN